MVTISPRGPGRKKQKKSSRILYFTLVLSVVALVVAPVLYLISEQNALSRFQKTATCDRAYHEIEGEAIVNPDGSCNVQFERNPQESISLKALWSVTVLKTPLLGQQTSPILDGNKFVTNMMVSPNQSNLGILDITTLGSPTPVEVKVEDLSVSPTKLTVLLGEELYTLGEWYTVGSEERIPLTIVLENPIHEPTRLVLSLTQKAAGGETQRTYLLYVNLLPTTSIL